MTRQQWCWLYTGVWCQFMSESPEAGYLLCCLSHFFGDVALSQVGLLHHMTCCLICWPRRKWGSVPSSVTSDAYQNPRGHRPYTCPVLCSHVCLVKKQTLNTRSFNAAAVRCVISNSLLRPGYQTWLGAGHRRDGVSQHQHVSEDIVVSCEEEDRADE